MANQRSALQLTKQQVAIVNHNHGPALVFAVAGAGKTTALEHRIARLVRDGVFAADRILATTFNTKNARELTTRLQQWPGCTAVQVATLNALGHTIIRTAFHQGLLPWLGHEALRAIDSATEELLNRTKSRAYQNKVIAPDLLEELDREDFLTYVSKCKGQLCYADLAAADLPPELHQWAAPALAPPNFPHYLDLYQCYEAVRHEVGRITFDDQVMTAWELLCRQPALRAEFQSRYDCVLVDEFQDVNKAQAAMLDLIVEPHRNYMAIGDDDQTIYEWRGADPTYILKFADQYQASVYLMTENFRCRASQVALANQVIQQNQQRRAKRVQLTQGFDGATYIQAHASPEQMAAASVDRMQQLQQRGAPLTAMVVLVRIYAQTPPLESELIARNIPYEIVGNRPFYMRPEVLTLIDYCRLAYLEGLRQTNRPFLPANQELWRSCWGKIYWRPKRYLSREQAGQIADICLHDRLPLVEALKRQANQAQPKAAEKINKLADDLAWLMQAFHPGSLADQPASAILQEFEKRIRYMDYLSQSSGFAETGADRAATIAAFLRYAQNQGSLLEFLQKVKQLSDQHGNESPDKTAKLQITSIFRAKGLEWPYVFVPNCNLDVLPHKLNPAGEEERRLLYVAITRAQHTLYLDYLSEEPISPYLAQADHTTVLQSVQKIAQAVNKSPSEWSDNDILAIAVDATRLHFDAYLRDWWSATAEQKITAARLVVGCYEVIQRHGLLQRMGLTAAHLEAWRAWLPAGERVEPFTRPGLETLLSAPAKPNAASAVKWRPGVRVSHPQHGVGKIVAINPITGEVCVRFDHTPLPKSVRRKELALA